MRFKSFLQGFSDFSESINEASSLSALGVPKDLLKYIHSLEGKEVKFGYRQDKQYDVKSGRELGDFATLTEPSKARGGEFPTRKDRRMSHDVVVRGKKVGRNQIYNYLTTELDPTKDIDTKLLLYIPETPPDENGDVEKNKFLYIVKKTGKLTDFQKVQLLKDLQKTDPDYLTDNGIVFSRIDFNKKADIIRALRQLGISNKRGLYLRAAMIDPNTGLPITLWLGTIGQVMDRWIIRDRDVLNQAQQPIMYIMEEEERAESAEKTRREAKIITTDQFLDYFVSNYSKIADKFFSTGKKEKEDEINRLLQSMNRENREEINSKIEKLEAELDKSPSVRKEELNLKLRNFLRYLIKEKGEYNGEYSADLSDVVSKHTLPGTASMFLQFIILNKVVTPLYTTSAVKLLGLEDLFN